MYLLDTPGFNDDRMRDEEILYASQKMLFETHKSTKFLTGIIYMHDITQAQIGSLGQKASHLPNLPSLLCLVGQDQLVLGATPFTLELCYVVI